MKKWFINLFVKQIFTSKKFIYAISSIIVPSICTALGVDEETASNLFYALLSLAGFQGLADLGKEAKKVCSDGSCEPKKTKKK
tara:strand:- start:7512 stop:7760 length:249 start_codon:yes stop_codon:yes gene_type:complete